MASNRIPSFTQCSLILGISSVKSRKVYPVNPAVWVERTAEGNTHVSNPHAEIIGSATVSEH